jgi:hypothetical protein
MESVFNEHQVCNDVRDIIAFYIHQGYQNEINKRIRIMVGFDWNYNYWNGTNNSKEIPTSDLYIWMDRYYESLDCDDLDINEYSFMCNRYKVFSLDKSLRRNLFIIKGEERIIEEIKDRKEELKIVKLLDSFNNNFENIDFLERTTAFLECKHTEWQAKVLMISSINIFNFSINNLYPIKNIKNIIFR